MNRQKLDQSTELVGDLEDKNKSIATPEEKTILTFGYGNRKDYEAFLAYLEQFDVTCVIDVRRSTRAWSGRWHGHSIEKLCTSKDIQYISKTSLGNTSESNHWIPPEDKEADQALSEVAEILETGNILLLCAEMDSSRCHRVDVASRLQGLTSASVKHLK